MEEADYQQFRDELLRSMKVPAQIYAKERAERDRERHKHLQEMLKQAQERVTQLEKREHASKVARPPDNAKNALQAAVERMKQERDRRNTPGGQAYLPPGIAGHAHQIYNTYFDSETQPPGVTRGGRKYIRSVVLEVSQDPISISDLGGLGSRQIQGPQRREWKDQDNIPVHKELFERLDHVLRQNAGDRDRFDAELQRVLDIWNNDDKPLKKGKRITVAPSGHKTHCIYDGTHDYPCTCQPMTLWAETEVWLCDCCAEPRAAIRFGLCDMCEGHQYADGHNAEIEHDARRQSE